jgi:hypothetical protein
MTFKHPDITSAELIDEPEGDGKVVVVLKIATELQLDADASDYKPERVRALLSGIERYKADNPQVDRVRLATTAA